MAYDNLTDVASLKRWLIGASVISQSTTSPDDNEYAALIQVASELIGRFCGRDNLGSVYTYTENYFKRGSSKLGVRLDFDLVLRHYPVTALTSVVVNSSPIVLLNEAGLQAAQAGVYLLEDIESRILKFQYLYALYPITVTYAAGYAANAIPSPLKQAANQFASEIFRSNTWIGKKSAAIAGETITYDTNGVWGMSNRVKMLIQPYVDVVPFRSF
jgi:hypothetical protein